MMILKKYIIASLLIISTMFLFAGCFSVKYSLSGATVPAELKTLSVVPFNDVSNSGLTNLSRDFTNQLRTKCESKTRLTIIADGGDATFEGEITGYNATQPSAIQSDDMAATNRFTVSVHVKFYNSADPKLDYDANFTKYKDYPTTLSVNQAVSTVLPEIMNELTDDIFNKAFLNW
jgi:hypothetical protein